MNELVGRSLAVVAQRNVPQPWLDIAAPRCSELTLTFEDGRQLRILGSFEARVEDSGALEVRGHYVREVG